MDVPADGDPWDYTLGYSDVAALLGVHRSRVNKIPPEQLPYRETPGGSFKGGRRKYRPEDVEAYRRSRMRTDARFTAVEVDIADLKADVADLKAWRESFERDQSPE